MFQCEYGDGESLRRELAGIFKVYPELSLRMILDRHPMGDAPDFIQLNWNNTVLWRGIARYPTNGGGR